MTKRLESNYDESLFLGLFILSAGGGGILEEREP